VKPPRANGLDALTPQQDLKNIIAHLQFIQRTAAALEHQVRTHIWRLNAKERKAAKKGQDNAHNNPHR